MRNQNHKQFREDVFVILNISCKTYKDVLVVYIRYFDGKYRPGRVYIGQSALEFTLHSSLFTEKQ